MDTAVVFVGGPGAQLSDPARSSLDAQADLVVAVDSGLHLAHSIGHRVDVVIGDMDSVEPAQLSAAQASGAEVKRYPSDKDQTDLELALDHTVQLGAQRITVIGGRAGRLDHLLGAVAVLSADGYRSCAITGWFDGTRVLPVHDRRSVHGEVGSTMSILAMRSSTTVTVSGVRWPLEHAALPIASTRGVSNVMTEQVAEVRVHDGVAVVVIPEEGAQ